MSGNDTDTAIVAYARKRIRAGTATVEFMALTFYLSKDSFPKDDREFMDWCNVHVPLMVDRTKPEGDEATEAKEFADIILAIMGDS